MCRHGAVAVTLVLAANTVCWAGEPVVQARYVSAGLFKNGLAVIHREVKFDQPGTFRLDDAPEPVHGTYWIESTTPIESRIQTQEVDVPFVPSGTSLQEELAGRNVRLTFKNDKLPILRGQVITAPLPKPTDAGQEDTPMVRPAPSRFLILQTEQGRVYVDPNEVAFIAADGTANTVKRRKAVLLLTVPPDAKLPTVARISYLTSGLSWAPSYRIDLKSDRELTLAQLGVIRNELVDLIDTELNLITGYPSVQFAHVTSPLAASMSWSKFFQQAVQDTSWSRRGFDNSMLSQRLDLNVRRNEGGEPAIGPVPAGEGIDLYYFNLGKRSLPRNESMALTTAEKSTEYQRIVEWFIPDNRDEHGSPVMSRGQEEGRHDDVWDALKFRNPLGFPMTSGPAMVTVKGRFAGQRLSTWVNAGEETTLRVNKALSIRTRHVEHEKGRPGSDDRDITYIGGRRFRLVRVQGELLTANHRSEAVTLLIRRRFSGELEKAEGDPKVDLREEGVYAYNKRNEMKWTLTLKPGEERTLKYEYAVLVTF